jgi:Domain of unknown function (DUF4419)
MSTIAPILEHTQSQIRFCVDNVEPTQTLLPIESARLLLEQNVQKSLLAFSHDDTFLVIQGQAIHPLALAVHMAFSEHRPLLLTPDQIWLTIAQGFAQHINNHAEVLRSRFVNHSGKKQLVVSTLQIPTQRQEWAEIIHSWVLQIRDHVGADLHRLLECNFSTTTPITQTASHVVMMDTFRQYFDYILYCICGIPEITLLGTVADWQSIYDRVQCMADYDLAWWTDRLLPICQGLVQTAAGEPALEFWQGIYKPKTIYGGDRITGWLAELFPYLQDPVTHAVTVQNPILAVDRATLKVENGISPNSLPLGLSKVVIKLKADQAHPYELELIAGLIGVHQDPQQGTLQAEIGWAVREHDDQFGQLLDRIQRQHQAHPPVQRSELSYRNLGEHTSKDLIRMLEYFDGATLYPDSGYSWQIARLSDHRSYAMPEPHPYYGKASHFMDLEDGRCIAYTAVSCNEWWLVVGNPTSVDRPPSPYHHGGTDVIIPDAVVIAQSIPQLFERIFQAEGRYFFDDRSFIPDVYFE